jgi:hypothetical protein
MNSKNSIKELMSQYTLINEAALCSGKAPIFNPTSKIIAAMNDIILPKSKDDFEKFVKNLFILFCEGSVDSQIVQRIDHEDVIRKIKELRNHFEHDREQGDNEKDIRKKFEKVGGIFEWLIGKSYPSDNKDWATAGLSLVHKLITFSENALEELPIRSSKNCSIKEQEKTTSITPPSRFFDHKITLFPQGSKKFRECAISKKLSDSISGSSIIFLPTYNYSCNPEFGNTHQAIYLTSEAPCANFDNFKKFLLAIEDNWISGFGGGFTPDSALTPWSITFPDRLVYGSGAENLIDALSRNYKDSRATISMVLQGVYGEDNTQTFFIVIGSDLKGGAFYYTFIDFYLCSVPLDWEPIKTFISSLDKLSLYNKKATHYSLRNYVYHVWEAKEEINFKTGVIGGIGRNGYDNRAWDNFEGLILPQTDLQADYILDVDSSSEFEGGPVTCPIDWLDEFVISATNVPPTYEEIKRSDFTGIHRPRVYQFGFYAKGWEIYAINLWGWAKSKKR